MVLLVTNQEFALLSALARAVNITETSLIYTALSPHVGAHLSSSDQQRA